MSRSFNRFHVLERDVTGDDIEYTGTWTGHELDGSIYENLYETYERDMVRHLPRRASGAPC